MNEVHKKYYITQSNLRKLVFKAGIVERDLSNLYEDIFDRVDLRQYVSTHEAQRLHAIAFFLQQSEDYLAKLAATIKTAPQRMHDSPFVFVSGLPKYHRDETCETLSQDFNNFEIPTEITARGSAAVAEFRDFASKNRKLLNEGKEDVFLNRLQRQFHLQHPIGKVSFVNSGRTLLPEHDGDNNLEQIAVRIEGTIARLEAIRETADGAQVFKSHIYAPASRILRTDNLSPLAKQLLEHKKTLIDLVTEYVTVKHHGSDRTFSEHLLRLYEFEPCGICCKDEVAFDLS